MVFKHDRLYGDIRQEIVKTFGAMQVRTITNIEINMWQQWQCKHRGNATRRRLSLGNLQARNLASNSVYAKFYLKFEFWAPWVCVLFFGIVFEVISHKWGKHELLVPCLPNFTDNVIIKRKIVTFPKSKLWWIMWRCPPWYVR